MKKLIKLVLLIAVIFLLSGCATLFKTDSLKQIPVASAPQGAEIFINGVSYGVTPTTLKLEDGENYNIVFKQGDETRTYTLKSEIGILWLVLDIVGGGIPLIVDAATGDWMELPEDEIFINF